jgi:DNA/RNA-binding domain of Phe-tRNA-synthetase-like protein
MYFIIDPILFKTFPDLRVGLVKAAEINNNADNPRLIELIQHNIDTLKKNFKDKDLLSNPNIAAWRDTYNLLGVKASKFKPTAEALLRRILNDKPFPYINNAVNSYLAVELLFHLPIGGYDLDLIEGDINLRISTGGETFKPLGGTEYEKTDDKEIIYADNLKVLTRKWNYRDSDLSKITNNTRNLVLVTEASMSAVSDSDLNNSTALIKQYLDEYCGGVSSTHFLNKNKSKVEL